MVADSVEKQTPLPKKCRPNKEMQASLLLASKNRTAEEMYCSCNTIRDSSIMDSVKVSNKTIIATFADYTLGSAQCVCVDQESKGPMERSSNFT